MFGGSELLESLEWFECTVSHWPKTLSDGVEMEKAGLLYMLCAYSVGICVAPFGIGLCELGESVFLEYRAEGEMECTTDVCIEVQALSGDAGALLPRTGMVWGF